MVSIVPSLQRKRNG